MNVGSGEESMMYESTRGSAPQIRFGDVLLSGLASDGGLYVPTSWPQLPPLDSLRGRTYSEVAVEVMWPFVKGELERGDFEAIVAESYKNFQDPEVCPVRPIGSTAAGADLWLLELSGGPTLAFKDVALQLVGRLFDHVLREREQRVCILGATSGDTGSAAIEAVRDRDRIEIFVLFPHGRVSEVQRRQMTTVEASNVHTIAIDGTFDDCQDLVKAAFGDENFRSEVGLSAVNSINWARVMAQIVYYVTAHLEVSPDGDPVSFCVPTGNFGNILAGWVAKQMGLPVDRLVVASNRNDILTRFFTTGTMDIRDVVPTTSPSMDIQVSSNLERLLFEILGRDGAAVTKMMGEFRADGTVSVDSAVLGLLRSEFDAERADDEESAQVMRSTHESTGLVIDPHTAVAVTAARRSTGDPSVPMVALSTADPAKFPDAVEAALGIKVQLPARVAHILDRPERIQRCSNDLEAVERCIRAELGAK